MNAEMNAQLFKKTMALLAIAQLLIGCNRFVWHEDPFTPDQAPTSETLVTGSDTTYVLERPSYYLLASQRATVWHRDVMDDVAWRYHGLFGEYPPMIAVRIDSVRAADTTTTWRGVPLAHVVLGRRPPITPPQRNGERLREYPVEDSVRARTLAGPMLASAAAGTWLEARTLGARVSDNQPGGPTRKSAATSKMPVWMEAGALRILASAGAVDGANEALRLDPKRIVSLTS